MNVTIKSKTEKTLAKKSEVILLLGISMLTGGIGMTIIATIIGIRLRLGMNDLLFPIATATILIITAAILILFSVKPRITNTLIDRD